jgi:drug/metabolite transporter (DMT)-like permease
MSAEHSNQTQFMNLRDWLMLALLGVIWGCSYFFIGVAVTELPPLTIAASRVVLAGVTLWCVVIALQIPMTWSWQAIKAFFVIGLVNNAAPFTFIIWAQTHIASGLAGILVASTPLFGVILAGLTLSDERMTPMRLFGAGVGFAGVVLVIGVEALHGIDGHLLAIFACLAGSFCFAVGGIFGRRFAALGIAPMFAATAQVTTSSLLLVPIALVVDQPWTLAVPGPGVIAAVVALALGSTALGFILYFRVLASAGATNVLLVNFLIPIPAIVLGIAVLGEKMQNTHYLGLALLALGLSAVDGRLWKRREL